MSGYKMCCLIIRKEALEFSKNKSFIMYYLYLSIGAGIVMPIFTQYNQKVFGVATSLILITLMIAMIIPSTLIADTFAGEKERKTLETLISTPISIFQIFVGKVMFVTLTTACVLSIVYILQLFVFNGVHLINEGKLIYPFNGVSTFIVTISAIGIASFIATFGAFISLNSKNVKTCNLVVVLVSSPILAPLLIALNQQIVRVELIKLYSLGLFLVAFLLCIYFRFTVNKIKVMKKIKGMA